MLSRRKPSVEEQMGVLGGGARGGGENSMTRDCGSVSHCFSCLVKRVMPHRVSCLICDDIFKTILNMEL